MMYCVKQGLEYYTYSLLYSQEYALPAISDENQ